MTEQELIQENEKLTARLKKAVEVFNEQKATITRQEEEIASLKQKAEDANKNDDKFFELVNEIETLKGNLNAVTKKRDDLNKRLENAGKEYNNLKYELTTIQQTADAERQTSENLMNKINKVKAILEN